MTPKPTSLMAWIDVFKNVLLIGIGIFIVLHETLDVGYPSVVLLLVAAACLGLPIADRIAGLKNGRG